MKKEDIMNIIRKIEVFGDSILKGIQLNKEHRYCVDNQIDFGLLNERFSVEIGNHSKMGCTITKAESLVDKFLQSSPECSAIVMDLGGNDCNFDWAEVAETPDSEHEPKTPLILFEETYKRIIKKLKDSAITPILTTLPPLDPQRFFDWWCRGLNKEAILSWLGSVQGIYRFHENYSRAVECIAKAAAVPIVDLRGAFLRNRRIEHLLCEDGTHPNTAGHRVITSAFLEFGNSFAFA
ncbi:MAG: SGNH/GDSL hydrolase family protein [Oscillospiraceae bacterium]|nr:SGNH/GDSL hydrolase family protein [Oscillospiraceae bacterium]